MFDDFTGICQYEIVKGDLYGGRGSDPVDRASTSAHCLFDFLVRLLVRAYEDVFPLSLGISEEETVLP